MDWDFHDQLRHVDLAGGGDAYYVYDATGQRVRKVIERNGCALIEGCLYLGGFEVFRTLPPRPFYERKLAAWFAYQGFIRN